MMRTAAVLAVIAACSSSKDTPTPGSAAKPAATPAAPTSSGGLTKDVDVCGLMPAATIAQITGKAFTNADGKDDEHTKAFGVYSCNYTGANQLSLSIVGRHGKIGYDGKIENFKTAGQKIEDVPGIGDAAFSSNNLMVRLEVLYGDITITVSGWADLPLDQAKQIVSQLHDKMTAK